MKQTIKAFMFMELGYGDFATEDWAEKWRPDIRTFKSEDNDKRIFIREMPIEVDVPDDFDPIPKQVAALEKEKLEALQEYQRKVGEINERLSKLQAITYEPQEVA